MYTSSRTRYISCLKDLEIWITLVVLVCGNYVEFGCTDYTDPHLYGEDGLPTFRPLVRTRTDTGSRTRANFYQGQKHCLRTRQIQIQGQGQTLSRTWKTLLKDRKTLIKDKKNTNQGQEKHWSRTRKTLIKDKNTLIKDKKNTV